MTVGVFSNVTYTEPQARAMLYEAVNSCGGLFALQFVNKEANEIKAVGLLAQICDLRTSEFGVHVAFCTVDRTDLRQVEPTATDSGEPYTQGRVTLWQDTPNSYRTRGMCATMAEQIYNMDVQASRLEAELWRYNGNLHEAAKADARPSLEQRVEEMINSLYENPSTCEIWTCVCWAALLYHFDTPVRYEALQTQDSEQRLAFIWKAYQDLIDKLTKERQHFRRQQEAYGSSEEGNALGGLGGRASAYYVGLADGDVVRDVKASY
ncbi:unnamed protein product [Vitrella brassicaformis CCMP3155]|uniref:Uncharacterized protein n=2 Tax=Vitrella brassicaformis TaxID=1169539 RepID=A0A0G4GB51_VITBC|nr:unnamed protein product [Vitrella brassicaformis CCMP3155]|eukprot:CEM26360.1 unnamed protein product [Vitrella brassicaformis CCMP3155]